MFHLNRFRTCRAWLAAALLACALPAMAGLSVYTTWGTLPPVSVPMRRPDLAQAIRTRFISLLALPRQRSRESHRL